MRYSLLCTLLIITSGCASMCDSSLDADFHAFGGMRDRQDRVNGRVASLFDSAASLDSILPAQDALPEYDRNRDSSDANGDGTVDDAILRDELLNKLKELEPLPEEPIEGTGLDEI